jgi:hypothetical protein
MQGMAAQARDGASREKIAAAAILAVQAWPWTGIDAATNTPKLPTQPA